MAVNVTSEDCSLAGQLATIQRNERIRRGVWVVTVYGGMICVIAVLLAVLILILIWAGGREARVAWSRA